MLETVIDRIGTLALIDTGRRCSTRNIRILAVECSKCGRSPDLLHDAIADAYWQTTRLLNGYHQGCDPNSAWVRDPVGTKLRHDAMRSLLDKADACPACGEYRCTGTSS